MNQVSVDASKEQLIADFKTVVADAEALLKATTNQGGHELTALRAKAEASLETAKARIAAEQEALFGSAKEAVKTTDLYVHENPWAAVGVGVGLGLLVGLLSARR
ncbi:MAG: DUF883 domain-containing protein [Zetaproteobacteria bacterium CG02_land_8_20_14_3_00_50_9]|nr:MAG: hypothetical protein COW62_10475 [Zetaproteobacteria bacterium CG17_big_fil_post_rev_8_21_14_2_50_50_13]PIV29659.1 MAG: DUF883 domain-containing protein [Zetaproteobacteria bacterium CG02_land_8_20_14_3_00_50_9]